MTSSTTAQRWAFLGPSGTFTEMALRQVAPVDVELDPCQDVPTALDRVHECQAEAAVVPIENSIEGGVNATIDNLVAGAPLTIAAEMAVPITFVLAGRQGTRCCIYETRPAARRSAIVHARAQAAAMAEVSAINPLVNQFFMHSVGTR